MSNAWAPPQCKQCENTCFEEGGFGLDFCTICGLGKPGSLRNDWQFVFQDRIPGQQSYTRLKRFKKYLCRAMRQQSSCSVPKDTWDYLWSKRPYRDAKHVQLTLKRARHLKRKCYDSLPLLVQNLCPHVNVPSLTRFDKQRAITAFKTLDAAYGDGEPFVSYLFALEFILELIGRSDVLPFINKISCKKRRSAYRCRLNKVFNSMPCNPGYLAGLSVYQQVVRNGCRPEL